jgi:ParB family chromosome partitioning protein
MSKSAPRLGKGLSALIRPRPTGPLTDRALPPSAPAPDALLRAATLVREISLDSIRPNPHQPRFNIDRSSLDQLAESLRQTGVLQPILVRALSATDFELIAGERRWRAAGIAGFDTIPAIVRELSDAQSFELALIENLQREDLGPLERANAYQQLMDTLSATVDEIAARLCESRANVVNYLRLLKLTEPVRNMISAGQLAMGHARAIAAIDDPQRQLAIARLAVRRNLSVRQVELLVKSGGASPSRIHDSSSGATVHFSEVEQALSKALGLPVTLRPGKRKNSGRVVIRYNSLEEFDRISERIAGHPLTNLTE